MTPAASIPTEPEQRKRHRMHGLSQIPPIPLHRFLRSDLRTVDAESLGGLEDADAIFGVDVMTGRNVLLFGSKVLREIARTQTPRRLRVVRISLDLATDELDVACQLVKRAKARCDYRRGIQW